MEDILKGVRDLESKNGVLVIKETRFPFSRLLAEIAEGATLLDIADDSDLDINQLIRIFQDLSDLLNK
jgi:uncharacterized protein (DUF433 family)